jgi:hypothetical protein
MSPWVISSIIIHYSGYRNGVQNIRGILVLHSLSERKNTLLYLVSMRILGFT